MTRDEIYDHLAQVYLGKREKLEEKKKETLNAWLVINIVITLIILTSTFYGLTAFLTNRPPIAKSAILFSLTNGPVKIVYNLNEPYPQIKSFALNVPSVNASKYKNLSFSVRGLEEGYPGIIKVVVKNQKNETASIFVKDVRLKWQSLNIPFEEFAQITDWSNIKEVSFILEAWNSEKKQGIVIIDDVCFSS